MYIKQSSRWYCVGVIYVYLYQFCFLLLLLMIKYVFPNISIAHAIHAE